MFNSTGLFKEVQCPQGTNCSFLNCIFSHIEPDRSERNNVSVPAIIYDPTSAPEPYEPPLKKRRLSPAGKETIDEQEESESTLIARSGSLANGGTAQKAKPKPELASKKQIYQNPPKIRKPPASINRTVSPPLSRPCRKSDGSQPERTPISHNGTRAPARLANLPKESLTPRLLTPNPAPHPIRLAILKKIHEQITRLNDEALRDQATKDEPVLSETEVITMALDEEEKMGRENPQIYKNVVGHRIQRLKKMKLEEWKSSVLEEFQRRYMPPKPHATPKEKTVETGLTARQEVAVLAQIITPVKGLEAHGYVTTPPTAEEIKATEDGVKAAAGFERCDRCGTRFQVFPGRNSDETSKTYGRLTSTENGCTYHWSKPFRPPKSSAGVGEQESYYLCCRGAIGSKGCTQASDHVFKASEVKRMASILQFESTSWPAEDTDRPRGPVTFDCEMGYTTFGMELIRLTAVSWPQNQQLLDVLVRPLGEVIDYNTRFSGVSQEHFSKALPYGAEKAKQNDSASEDGELEQQPLRVIESPMAARKLLFDLLTPETPLIGHAIDNDLNTCRVIHPTIVDTVLLFPHPRGLPIRYGLKMLAGKYLERSIQTGGALGHDSKEDAIATGELVRFKVGEKWKHMKLQGWTFQDAKLVPPIGLVKKIPDGPKVLKRPASQLDGAVGED
jgi:DNA polymerase III epsilon subunit-like protein